MSSASRARASLRELLEAHDRLYRFATHVVRNACDMPGEPDYVIVNRFQMEGLRGALEAEDRPRDSGRLPQGENAERSGAVECEASQSGGSEASASPNPNPET